MCTFLHFASFGRTVVRLGVARDVPGLESSGAHVEHLRSLGFREQGDFCEQMACLLSQMDAKGKSGPEDTDFYAAAVYFKEQGMLVREKYTMFKRQMRSMAS